jgi:hypothetical protein
MNGAPSIAKSLFDEIMNHAGHADSVAFLKSMVNSTPPTMESEYRDFKGGTTPTGGKTPASALSENEVKKIWSEALVGFATTSGGVLVWGLDARRQPGDTVDRVVALNLVHDPNGMKSRLQQLLPQATDPPIPGVQIEAFVDSTHPDKGFVVCYIPESSYKPHRTEMGGKKWVMRISDSFVDVPPPVLRSLFFPHRHSYIFMRAAAVIENAADVSSGVMNVRFDFRLYNEGPATAHELLLIAKPVNGVTYTQLPLWQELNTPAGRRFIYVQAFHPGQMIEAVPASIVLPFTPAAARQMGRANNNVDLEFQLYATDQVPQQFTFHFDGDDIRNQRELKALPEPVPMTRYR